MISDMRGVAIFTLKIIHVKNFLVDKFSRLVRPAKFFLAVDGYVMDKRLKRS